TLEIDLQRAIEGELKGPIFCLTHRHSTSAPPLIASKPTSVNDSARSYHTSSTPGKWKSGIEASHLEALDQKLVQLSVSFGASLNQLAAALEPVATLQDRLVHLAVEFEAAQTLRQEYSDIGAEFRAKSTRCTPRWLLLKNLVHAKSNFLIHARSMNRVSRASGPTDDFYPTEFVRHRHHSVQATAPPIGLIARPHSAQNFGSAAARVPHWEQKRILLDGDCDGCGS